MRNICLILGFLLGFAHAQASPDAAKLLEAARSAHGGQALVSLRTYQEKATLIAYEQGQETNRMTVVSYVDFLFGRMRLEYRDGDHLIQVIQVSRTEAKSWSELQGTHPLEPQQAQDIRDGFYQTWYGLKQGGGGRDAARLEGNKTVAGVSGKAVSLKTKGVTTTYIFNGQNQLIAERYRNSQGTLSISYSDLRAVSGVKIPFQASIYADGMLFAEIKILEAKINPVFPSKTFNLP